MVCQAPQQLRHPEHIEHVPPQGAGDGDCSERELGLAQLRLTWMIHSSMTPGTIPFCASLSAFSAHDFHWEAEEKVSRPMPFAMPLSSCVTLSTKNMSLGKLVMADCFSSESGPNASILQGSAWHAQRGWSACNLRSIYLSVEKTRRQCTEVHAQCGWSACNLRSIYLSVGKTRRQCTKVHVA